MAAQLQAREQPSGSDITSGLNETGDEIGAHLAVKLDSTKYQVEFVGATTELAYGLTMRAIPDGEYGPIQKSGIAIAIAGEALANAGVKLMAGTAGKLVAWTTGKAVFAQLLTTAAADGDQIEVLIEKTPAIT